MKKIGRMLLVVLIVNLFSSFIYAGIDEFPRPSSIKPISTLDNSAY